MRPGATVHGTTFGYFRFVLIRRRLSDLRVQAARARAERPDDVVPAVPRILRVAAALGWRLLLVVAALYVIDVVASYLAPIVIPVAVALLLAALLSPAVHRLQAHGVPRGIATVLVMVGGLALLGGVLTFVVITFVRGVPALAAQLSTSVDTIVDWLTTGPLQLSAQQLSGVQTRSSTPSARTSRPSPPARSPPPQPSARSSPRR